ncbi:MAG TPA: hypothetical protein VMR33_05350 [Candidatus Baltobacteraceae bacterium]|jgi:hypothetical protein|nr:hypothetical protein [Candidatus Baltobacteraceae bacterium]
MLALEADIHREQFSREWADFKAGFQEFGRAAKSTRSIVTVASVVAAGASAFRRLRGGRGALLKLLAGAGFVSALWFAYRSRSR